MQIVAEIGLQHCGCLGTASAFVDACADAGVDVVKFQCHDGDACVSFRQGMENYFPQDQDRQSYWRRTGFTGAEWAKLAAKIHKRGLAFCCSVFSLAGIQQVGDFVQTWKVPSSKTNDLELLRAMKATGKPVVVSTGMSTPDEVDDAIDVLGSENVTILQCLSEYPTKPERIDVSCQCGYTHRPERWGLSDHSGTIWPGIVAAWKCADMLEVHVCWSKEQWGPDVSSSLTIEQLRQLVEGVRFVERMPLKSLSKNELAKELEPVRRVFRGS